MFIKEIIIKNFQSHKYTKISLSENINVFLGKGNAGKSAIIRAIIWVLFNEPKGSEFIRKGEGSAFVSITLDNGFKVIREKGNNVNKYTLISPDGTIKEFSNFGFDVPEEIRRVLGIKTLPLENGKKLNPQIKEQMENIYLLDESPSIIHSTLLTISGGQVFDEAINSIITDLQRLDRKEKELKKEIEEKAFLLKKYEGIDDKKENLIKLKKEIDLNKKEIEKKNNLENLDKELKNIKRERENTFKSYNILIKVDPLEKESLSLNEYKNKITDLKNKVSNFEKTRDNIKRILKEIEIINKSELNEEIPLKLKILKEKLENLKTLKNSLFNIKKEIDLILNENEKIEKSINLNIEEYNKVIFDNKVCPVCNREIDESVKDKIKENLGKLWR
ncbi:MAG: AAA family ATPase [Caldisericia bacterium]|nr:AAA family ATPase [Caldisericia bacterium]